MSTALAVLAVLVGAWLGVATLVEQREEIAALKREVGTLDIVVAGLRGAGPRGYALREPDRVYKRPWYRHRNAWRWERSARAGVRWGWGLKRLVELELQAPSRWGQACAALRGADKASVIDVLVENPVRRRKRNSSKAQTP